MSITELLCRMIHSKELAKISFGCCIRCTGGAGLSHLQINKARLSPLSQYGTISLVMCWLDLLFPVNYPIELLQQLQAASH